MDGCSSCEVCFLAEASFEDPSSVTIASKALMLYLLGL